MSKDVSADTMGGAFPDGGWTQCSSERGKVNWAKVKELESAGQGEKAFNHIRNEIYPCLNNDNPNFMKNMKNTCKTNTGSQLQAQVCEAIGTPVQGVNMDAVNCPDLNDENNALKGENSTLKGQLTIAEKRIKQLESEVTKQQEEVDRQRGIGRSILESKNRAWAAYKEKEIALRKCQKGG